MLKSLVAVVVLSSLTGLAFSQAASAPAPGTAASTPKKHRLHAPKLRKGAASAVSPLSSPDKKGGA